ncbi:type VI secretion system TssO [Plebeiibacterium sediminum]|uniref:Type VI secretion system transmembrane protein TssO n=1 Tax=Plebeiibacterium sediminum TaxID=2992112 RepID=A0AAE3M8K2_9BACT|nr:type VI secretion system TssO [Plebeiobacterium sediminum]MCW3788874.1 type VI secretion system transmembrane protein TssO [Plebeiobacterium sediminum]
MKPINSKQRNKAFFIYLLLFVITNAFVVGIVYFNFKVPDDENQFLHNKIDYLSLKTEEQKDFVQKMNRVKSLLDTMDTHGVSREYVEQLISTELAFMRTNFAARDSSYLGDMYNNVIVTYLELKVAKSQLKELEDAKSDIDTYVETIDKLNDKLKEVERDLSICRQLNR